ncbi:MAG TPA: AAA family ATPase [Polyangiales bacterium]
MGRSPTDETSVPAAVSLVDGRYRVTRRLARGAMGEVYAATDESTARVVAVKRMLPEALGTGGASAYFSHEYHALAELRHPRIIEVYDYGIDAGVPYYTMELLDGQDLRELAPLPAKTACLYLRDVASSLALLHARRLLHRDVSPRNVRRTSDGHCKLIDFGTMVAFGVPPNIAGTPPYLPPEALRGSSLDQRSDLYSLGALAYFLLTRKHSYSVSRLEDLPRAYRQPLLRPRRLVPDIPTALDELVMSLMRLDPLQRPRNAAEVIELLNAIGELPADTSPDIAQSFLTNSHLVGRDHEQAEIVRRLERGVAGHGSALLIYGEQGTGKSRLLAESVRLAQTHGFVTVQAVARGQRGTETLSDELVRALKLSAPEEAATTLDARTSLFDALAGGDAPSKAPASEARARWQTALTQWFCEVARRRPLLVAIDDVERADELSAAFIAALAHEARTLPLVIVATRDQGKADGAFSALAALRQIAGKLTLSVLEKQHIAALVSSLFGDVPNVDRLSDWLYRVAHGNPALTLELAEHLLVRGVVRYVEGAWALPSEEIVEAVPEDLTQTLGLRLLRLRPAALALAELMSVRRGGLSLALAAAVGESELSELLGSVDKLVREGIVELAGLEYVFAQQAMQEAVRRSLSTERQAVLHERLARALLGEASLDARLEAGWHLVHTHNELQGAELLAIVGPQLVSEGLNTGSAIPAIEKALAVYERHGRPLAERLRLRSLLVMSAYLVDYRLGQRYGEETIGQLYECSGLAMADRWRPRLGGPLALLCAMVVTNLKRWFVRARDRAPSTMTALVYFSRCVMGLMGVRATALDGPGTAALFARMASVGVLPSPLGTRAVYLAAKVFALQPLGRQGELHGAIAQALDQLQNRGAWLLQDTERQDLLVGLLLSDGVDECYRERSQALERASRLDGLGTERAAASAKRIRMMYHTIRGETELAERERSALELHGIQGGTTWQFEWFAVPMEGLYGALHGDLLAAHRSLDKLDAMLSHVPSLEPQRDAVRIGYHYRRGRHERAIELGEAFMAQHAPRTLIGWGPAYGMIAMSMVEHGRASRALEVCERALSALTNEDQPYFATYAWVMAAQAAAHAALGNVERAESTMRAIVTRLSDAGEHAAVALLHETRARIAWRLDDRDGLQQAVANMRRAALASGSVSLVAIADRLAQLRAGQTHNSSPPTAHATLRGGKVAAANEAGENTAVTAFLLGKSQIERARHALRMLAQATHTTRGFLYTRSGVQLILAAALDDADPLEPLERALVGLLERRSGAGQYVLEVADPDAPEQPPLQRARFHVLALASEPGGECIGIAALREGIEPVARMRAALLDEVGRLLGATLTAENALASAPTEH